MGIDLAQFRLLTALSARYKPNGRALMLGRQALRVNPKNRLRMNRMLRMAGHQMTWRDLAQEDGFSETMWDKLGFGACETMDMSDYEGAQILHDLNAPVPDNLEGQFDFIFDGGTIEHVFNVPVALLNVFRMLRPGGRFVSANGLNGWVGHGLYQFNPDLVWTFWKRACGCIVHTCLGVARDENVEDVVFDDVDEFGTRLRLRGTLPTTRVYLYYEVEKPAGAAYNATVLQSDYRARWSEAATRKAAE
jgi:SAM-dependent methyltransferase